MYYTGVGSRKTPQEVLDILEDLAKTLSSMSVVLRSGGADGADSAFERGCDAINPKNKEIYLPWPGFNKRDSLLFYNLDAYDIAKTIIPHWNSLSKNVKKLHARNIHQVLGKNLDSPSSFLICWTPDGANSENLCTQETGGTRTAIILADRYKIPIFNLFRLNEKDKLNNFLKENFDIFL